MSVSVVIDDLENGLSSGEPAAVLAAAWEIAAWTRTLLVSSR